MPPPVGGLEAAGAPRTCRRGIRDFGLGLKLVQLIEFRRYVALRTNDASIAGDRLIVCSTTQ